MDRRKFFKRTFESIFLANVGTQLLSEASIATLFLPSDNEPISKFEESSSMENYPYKTYDFNLKGVDFNLCGLEHTPEFMIEWGNFFDSLVSKSSSVVAEARPDTGGEFFSTIFEMCEKHGKNVIYLDSVKREPNQIVLPDSVVLGELITSAVAIAASGSAIYELEKHATERRKFLEQVAKGFLASYFGYGALGNLLLNRAITTGKYGRLFYNAIEDYRDVKVTSGLLAVPDILESDEKSNYVLVLYHAAHVEGIKDYLANPLLRGFKRNIYKFTYDLLDNDFIRKYSFDGNTWVEVMKSPIPDSLSLE